MSAVLKSPKPPLASTSAVTYFCDTPMCSFHQPNPHNYHWATAGKLTVDRAYCDGRHLCLLCRHERGLQ